VFDYSYVIAYPAERLQKPASIFERRLFEGGGQRTLPPRPAAQTRAIHDQSDGCRRSLNQSGAIAVLIARISIGFIKQYRYSGIGSSTLPAQVLYVNYKLHFRSVKVRLLSVLCYIVSEEFVSAARMRSSTTR
jgi:hypothetical protein